MQPGSCNMHNPLKPSSKKSISLYWGGGQGIKQHGKNVKVWNKQHLKHDQLCYQKWKLKKPDRIPVKTDKTRELTFFDNRKEVFFHSHRYWWDPDEKNNFVLALHKKLQFLCNGQKSQAENLTSQKQLKGTFSVLLIRKACFEKQESVTWRELSSRKSS